MKCYPRSLFSCIVLILWPFVFTVEINEINRPTVGVIRWDAWNTINGKYDVISNRSRMWFNPERYYYRLPFFAKIISDNNVTMNEDIQVVCWYKKAYELSAFRVSISLSYITIKLIRTQLAWVWISRLVENSAHSTKNHSSKKRDLNEYFHNRGTGKDEKYLIRVTRIELCK